MSSSDGDNDTRGSEDFQPTAALQAPTRRQRKRVHVITDFWKNLVDSRRHLKGLLARKYMTLAKEQGDFISTQNAYRRLRTRCNAALAADLDSADALKEQIAYKELSFASRSVKALTPDELSRIHTSLYLSHGIPPSVAPKVVSYGLKGLSEIRKIQIHDMLLKDDDTIANLSEEIYQSYIVEARKVYQRNYGVPRNPDRLVDVKWTLASRREKCRPVRSTSRYLYDLPTVAKDALFRQFMTYTSISPHEALLRLDLRCKKEIAKQLQSADPGVVQSALQLLDQPFQAEEDILTMEEKTGIYPLLEEMYGIKGPYRYNVYSVGSRNLSEEVKMQIRREESKTQNRYRELATVIYSTYKSVMADYVKQK